MPDSASSARPLVVRFGAFGDMILLIPVLKLLAERYGQPCEVVSSGGWTEPLLARVPAAGQRVLLTSRRAPYWFNRSQQHLVAWLRARAPGPVYVFETDDKAHRLLARGRVPPGSICSLRDLPRQPDEHILAHALRLARLTPPDWSGAKNIPADAPAPDTRPTLSVADRADIAVWLERHAPGGRPVILLQPGNKKTMKGGNRRRASNVDWWSEENWAEVIAGVKEAQPDATVFLCGAPSERPIAEDIVRFLEDPARVVIATDDLPIPRLLALQERAHSMISVNTGPAHAAAAMGCPLVVMFSQAQHRSSALYAPVPTSAPVQILAPPAGAAEPGLSAIKPAQVVAAWRELVELRVADVSARKP